MYAARSRQSWGIGDLADLRRLAQWSKHLGAGMVLINPLHAALPLLPQEASPYSPSSRRYLNPLYLRIEELPGAARLEQDLQRLATLGHALNEDRHIDRDRVFRLKQEAFQLLWSRFDGDSDFDRFRIAEGRPFISLPSSAPWARSMAQIGGSGLYSIVALIPRMSNGSLMRMPTACDFMSGCNGC